MKHAVYSGTRNLYESMVWSAKSLVANSGVDRIHMLIEDDDFPYELPDGLFDVRNVREYADRTFPDTGVNAKTHFTKMALVRVCYEELLPGVDKVLQLDADTVVMSNVDAIWDIDVDGKWFAACQEIYSGYNPYEAAKYYNVGVCLFNVEQMREDKAQKRLVKFVNKRIANCVEQDALNYYGSRKRKIADMPMRYNENSACGYTDDPAIVHYVGYMDWQTNTRLPRREYLKLYRDKSWGEIMEMRNA